MFPLILKDFSRFGEKPLLALLDVSVPRNAVRFASIILYNSGGAARFQLMRCNGTLEYRQFLKTNILGSCFDSGYGEATPNEQNYYEAPNGRTPNHGRVRREAYRAPEGSHHHESYGSGGARGQYADYHRNNLERSYSQPDNSHHEHHSPANNYHRSTRHLSRDESYNSGYGSHSYNEQERYREDFPYNHHHQNSGQKRVRRWDECWEWRGRMFACNGSCVRVVVQRSE